MGTVESKEEIPSGNKEIPLEKKYPDYKPPENDYQLVFEAIKDLEYIMQIHFESSGDHLHEMIGTANRSLPQDLIIDMRALATIRNNLAHEYSFQTLQNRDDFVDKYRRCVHILNEEISRRKKEDEDFYNEVVQKHRAKNPLPKFVLEEKAAKEAAGAENITARSSCPIACF